MLDIAAQFPALAHQPHGQRLAFLDSAASAQKPAAVIQKLTDALTGPYANIHRGLYFNSAETTAAFETARTQIAAFLGANPTGLIFTRNATEAVNLVAQTWGRANLTAQDAIVLTELEHHANIVPWQLIQKEIGFTIRVIPVQASGTLDLTHFAETIRGAKLLAISQMSNVTGVRPPLDKLIPQAKAAGLAVLVDGAQGAVHGPQNLAELGADFYTLTAHKLYGPTGIGALWGRPEILAELPPYQGGGDMIEQVTLPTGTTFAAPPARFEAGTPAIAEALAFAAAVQFIQSLGWAAIQAHEHALSAHLSQQLAALPFLETYGAPTTGIVAFNITGCHASDVATLLDQQGVAVRSGHHCAMPLMQAFGITACCRASLAAYTTEADITQLVSALHKAHQMLA